MTETSGNGWSASSSPSAINVDTGWTCNGIAAPGGCRMGDCDTVFSYLFNALDTRVEEATPGWNWLYSYRANVNNPTSLSNHSSATALDYNAPLHPNGGAQYEGWSDTEVAEVRKILAELEGAIRWGADYTGTKDSMHFELVVSPAELAPIAQRIREDTVALTADDKEWISAEIHDQVWQLVAKDLLVSTDDEAADGNPNKYTLAAGVARSIRLGSLTYTGQQGKPHS